MIANNTHIKKTKGKSKLLTQIKEKMRTGGYSPKTIQAYIKWIKAFIIYNGKLHPSEMGKENVERFLTHLAVNRNVSASTQNQALAAILYLYKNIVIKKIGWLDDVIRARRSKRLPVVFTKQEVRNIFNYLSGIPKLICSLLYGSGLRLGEALKLRVKDINFEYKQIIVRQAKGNKDRITTLPNTVIPELKQHLNKVYLQHKEDLSNGQGLTKLPYALDKKYSNANKNYYWQYVFPAEKFIKDEYGFVYRYHIHESTIQELLGHNSVKTTMIYTHVAKTGAGVLSPLDGIR